MRGKGHPRERMGIRRIPGIGCIASKVQGGHVSGRAVSGGGALPVQPCRVMRFNTLNRAGSACQAVQCVWLAGRYQKTKRKGYEDMYARMNS